MKKGLAKACYLFFSTLANPARLAMLEILREGPKNVGDLAQLLRQEQSMVSHNLKPLERCRFVFKKREKKQQIYSINAETMGPIFKILASHSVKYCQTRKKCFSDSSLMLHKRQGASRRPHVTH